MENEQNQEDKVITISNAEFTTWGIKVKDEKGLVYNIPQFLKGTTEETKAFQIISKLPNLGVNLKKLFRFVTFPNSQGGQSRYVRNIMNISGQPNVINRGEQIVRQQIAKSKTKLEEEKWNEISKGKVRHGVTCEFIRLGADYNLETINKINKWTEFIMTGEMFNKDNNLNLDNVPVIEIQEEPLNDEEIRVENIPF